MKNSLRIHKWTHNEFNIFILGVLTRPRECLRLMGFPDSFVMPHNDTIMWRQSGNSIVVNVLMAIVEELIKTGIFKE